MDRPSSQLSLLFQTQPGLFKARTSVQFDVVPPPSNILQEKVAFILVADDGDAPGNLSLVRERVAVVLSTQLDIDISRVKDVFVVVVSLLMYLPT